MSWTEDSMASKTDDGDDIAIQVTKKVMGMSPQEVAELIKERGLEHLTDPDRIAEILDLPKLN